jgi:Mn2+/Fe2+ NRAMP family transporter
VGLVLATVFGLIVWIVLWALGAKALDSFLITILVIVVGATVRMLAPSMPGRRN